MKIDFKIKVPSEEEIKVRIHNDLIAEFSGDRVTPELIDAMKDLAFKSVMQMVKVDIDVKETK